MSVVAGYISPSHDEYVERKLGDDYIPAKHRLKMCKLSLADSAWISLSKWEAMQPCFVNFPEVINYHATFLRDKFPNHDLLLLYLCGVDHAIRCKLFLGQSYGVAAIARKKNFPGYFEKLKGLVHEELDDNFNFEDTETEDMSSTEIRERKKKCVLYEELMHPLAGLYMKNIQSINGNQ